MPPIDGSIDASGATRRLRELADIAGALGATAIAADANALAERATAGQLFVACLGQFKRGKSTLLNALLGEAILPTGVVPVTSAVTIVRHGASPSARIHYRDRPPDDVPVSRLAEFVTESGNPANGKGVAAVEVVYPNPLLRAGVCLIDTPGVGSASPLATDVTRGFVPQIDAALVVLGADPPISGEEVKLLEQVSTETSQFIFAINKADKLRDAELAEVLVFTERLLADRLGAVPESLFVVSAAERLQLGTPTRDWARLERALMELARDVKVGLLQRRVRSTIHRFGEQLVQAIETSREALQAPMETTDRRLDALRTWLEQAERALTDFGVLLVSEQQMLTKAVREDAATRMPKARMVALAELRAALDGSVNPRTRWTWRAAFPLAQETARRAVQAELTTVEGHAARAYQDGMARFVRLANDFLGRLAATEPLLAQLPPLEPPVELPAKGHFYFTDLMTLTARSPWDVLLDWLGSRAHQNQRIAERTSAYLARLLETNTSRVVNDLHERLVESRRELESELRARLTELVMSAQRAAQRARDIRVSGESAIRPELARLASLRQRVERIVSEEDTPHTRRDSMA